MDRIYILISFALVFGFIGLAGVADAGTYVCADANADSSVNVSDAVYIINYVFVGGAAPDPICMGDANADSSVNVSDAVYIINYVFVGGPVPEPDCCDDIFGTVTDIDGNVYQIVTIGSQVWMMENLKVTHYRNGDPIPNVTDGNAWQNLITGAYCDYSNDPDNVATYGRLYNWYAVDDSRNIAPEGWHVASDAEWQMLADYLGGSSIAGGKLKEAGTAHWQSPNTGATNESGFSALPGGYRYLAGDFAFMGVYARFWSATENGSFFAWYRILGYGGSQVGRSYYGAQYGFSVRCVRD